MLLSSTSLIALLITAAISLLLGWFGRNLIGKPSRKEVKLQDELNKTKTELGSFKHDVNNHFEKTADLFNDLSKQYKNLYHHLKTSSQQLCDPDYSSTMLKSEHDKNWQQIGFGTQPSNEFQPEHNWHPTYFEAREAQEKNKADEKVKPVKTSPTSAKISSASKEKESSVDKYKVVTTENTTEIKNKEEEVTA